MSSELMLPLFLGLIVVILLILAFMHLKDKETARRIRLFEKSIEDCNKQIYGLQKKLKEMELERDAPENNINMTIKQQVGHEIRHAMQPILETVQNLEGSIHSEREQLEDRLAMMEEKVKEVGYFPGATSTADENKILQMFQGGWSIDSIAKELRIPKEEVEFTLKLSSFK